MFGVSSTTLLLPYDYCLQDEQELPCLPLKFETHICSHHFRRGIITLAFALCKVTYTSVNGSPGLCHNRTTNNRICHRKFSRSANFEGFIHILQMHIYSMVETCCLRFVMLLFFSSSVCVLCDNSGFSPQLTLDQ